MDELDDILTDLTSCGSPECECGYNIEDNKPKLQTLITRKQDEALREGFDIGWTQSYEGWNSEYNQLKDYEAWKNEVLSNQKEGE